MWPISSLLLPGIGDFLHPTPSQDCRAASIVADSVNPPVLNPSAWNFEGQSRLHMSWILRLSLVEVFLQAAGAGGTCRSGG